MALFKPDPPSPPDPIATASAATGTNVSTAVANAFLSQTNQVTPQGSLQYDVTDKYKWKDPTTNQEYEIPRFTATQFLSPQQQQLYNLGNKSDINLAKMAVGQSGMLQGMLGTPFDPSRGNFNATQYLNQNPDVMQHAVTNGWDPQEYAAVHYQQHGQYEGRAPNNQPAIPGAPDIGRLTGTLAAQGNIGSMDTNAYLSAYPDVAAQAAQSGMDPGDFARQHYETYGRQEGRTAGQIGSQQRSLGDYGSQQFGFGDAGDITRSYGPADDFSSDRRRVEESLYERMDPQLQRDRAAMEARLADQGIKMGSPAYQAAMDQFNRQLTDTRLGITQQAGAEQQRMMDMAAQRAGFENAAQQQAYTQMLGRGQFFNQAQAQQFQEQLQAGTFANQAQQQTFQQEALRSQFTNAARAQDWQREQGIFAAQQGLRNQALSEQYQARNQPINEITALLSGSQVQNPNFVNTPNNQMPTVDVAGLINNRFSQDMDTYKQQSANFNSLMGGIFGMMGGMTRSDRRVKEDIDRVGTIFAAGPDGEKPLPIYEYAYKDDPSSTRHVGPMAQDVEKIDKSAVKTRRGVKYIDNTRMGSILKAA